MALPLRFNARTLATIVNTSTHSSSNQPSPTAVSTRQKSYKHDLELPKYKDIKQIEYAEFFQKLRQLNPGVDFSQQKEVHDAFKPTIVDTIGPREISVISRRAENVRSPRVIKSVLPDSYSSWVRLKREEQKFWAEPAMALEPPRSQAALKLPNYTSIGQIKYHSFIPELRDLNSSTSQIIPKHAKIALKQVVVGIMGERNFNRMQYAKAGSEHRTQWRRLMGEAAEYPKS